MLSLVSCSAWDKGIGSEATARLVFGEDSSAEDEEPRPAWVPPSVGFCSEPQGQHSVPDDVPVRSQEGHWLLGLGVARCAGRARRRVSGGERAKHAILSWRLERPYLIYCLACSVITAFLLAWNLAKGVQNQWNLPQWKHHRWEEALEVSIGVLMIAETLFTMRVLGVRNFFQTCWCIFDFCVALLTVVSICYGLEHLGRRGEICEADVPLLLLRFALQPVRVMAALGGAYRARAMQSRVDELRVDFDSLPTGGSAFVFLDEPR